MHFNNSKIIKISLGFFVFVLSSCSVEQTTSKVCEHNWSNYQVTVPATCTKLGEESRTCFLCGKTETKPASMIDHSWDSGIVSKAPTHQEEGVFTYTCEQCFVTKTESISKIPHSYVYSSIDEFKHLKACECGYSEALEHSFDNGTITRDATHTLDGQIDYTCEVCDFVKHVSIPKNEDAHTYSGWNLKDELYHIKTCECGYSELGAHHFDEGYISKPASHSEEGLIEYTCSDCGYKKYDVIPKSSNAHIYGEWKYLDEETHTRECLCGNKETKNHSFNEGTIVTSATHLVDGQIDFTCTDCGYVKHETISKLEDHSWNGWSYNNENSHIRVCECGESETKEHIWDNGVVTTDPTHTQIGIKTFTCVDCNGTKEVELPMISEHNYGEWMKNNTSTHKKVCECGDVVTENHIWNDGVFTPDEDGGTSGFKTYVCNVCHETRQQEVSGFEVINKYVFSNVTGTEISSSLNYPEFASDIETPILETTFSCNKYYTFSDVDLSKYSRVFFYYRQISDVYPAFCNSNKEIFYADMSTKIAGSDWNLFDLSYDKESNSWSILSTFVDLSGLEISNLTNFLLQTGGATPKMELSPLFGRLSDVHVLNTHGLEGSGYTLLDKMPLNLPDAVSSGEFSDILASDMTTFSNYLYCKDQVKNILFKDFDLENIDELKFYFKSLNNGTGNPMWFELGKLSDESIYSVYSSNSITWNEIYLLRNEDIFDVYANNIYKCSISSLSDLKVKVYKKQLISGLYGKVSASRISLVNNKSTQYQILYHVNDSRFGKHSAELLANKLNAAVGKNIFLVQSTNVKPSASSHKICVGSMMADLAHFDYSNVRGLNYRFVPDGSNIYVFGDTNFGTHNGVKHLLNKLIGYEYYYKNVETFTTDVSKISYQNEEFTSNTSFLVGYDVNAETRSDAGYSWENDFSYSLDVGLIGDGAAGKYGIYGGWHNEVTIANEKGLALYQTSIRSNPQKHMNLSSSINAKKVAEYLNTKYYINNKNDAMFCLMDDYSWYNSTDSQSMYSQIYYNFINLVADELEKIVTHKVSLVAVAYHQTIVCPTSWVPHSGKNVEIKVYFSPSDLIFSAKPDSKFNNKVIKMQDDIKDSPTLTYNPYENLLNWRTFANSNNIKLFAYLYNSLPNYFAPFLSAQYMLDYYKLFSEMKVERLYDMGQYDNANATDWNRLKIYLKGKLTDNCNITETEFNDLIVNFFTSYYGPAGSYMKAAFDKEFTTITNPVSPGTNDYDNYYGRKTDRKFPLYLRGYYYNKKGTISYPASSIFENKTKTGIMDYYDAALSAVSGNKILEDRVKLDGLALRYWYWGVSTPQDETGIYGGGPKFGFTNNRGETFESIIADAKILGVTQWGEGKDFTINNPVKG